MNNDTSNVTTADRTGNGLPPTPGTPPQTPARTSQDLPPLTVLWWLIVAAVSLGLMVWGLGSFLLANVSRPEITLGLLVTSGVLILVLALALIALAFRYVGLQNTNQALGLPEGSVRALLAIGLLLLVTIVSLYLYNDVARSKTISETTVAASDKAAVLNSLPPNSLFGTPQINADKKTVTIRYIVPPEQSGVDIAKQLVTILGTLLSAVVAFYFGATTARLGPSVRPGADHQAIG